MGRVFLIFSFKLNSLIVLKFRFFISSNLNLIKLVLQSLKGLIYLDLSFKKGLKIIYHNLKGLRIKKYYKGISINIKIITH